jgi:hypothetical protein
MLILSPVYQVFFRAHMVLPGQSSVVGLLGASLRTVLSPGRASKISPRPPRRISFTGTCVPPVCDR